MSLHDSNMTEGTGLLNDPSSAVFKSPLFLSSRPFVLLFCAVFFLTACSELREDLGLGRNPPDEFAVVERPPLSLPPDFALRPPRPGAPRPQSVDTSRQASDVLFSGNAVGEAQEASSAEKALLEASGADKAEANIRDLVDRDASQKVSASPHLLARLLGKESDEKPATTVDPAAEAERIKKAKEEGKPLNAGATPVIEKQDSGWLGL